MLSLGISGGPLVGGDPLLRLPHVDGYWHDSAAALVEDGRVLCALEEERLRRLTHTNRFPDCAIRACLADTGRPAAAVDHIAVSFSEEHWKRFLDEQMLYDPAFVVPSARALIAQRISDSVGQDVDPDRVVFVRHHVAHAMSAWVDSGFQRCLVLTLDGAGDTEAGIVATAAHGHGLDIRATIPVHQSLGAMYLWCTRYLGYGQFDEYRVMGLAAHGEAARVRDRVSPVELLAAGGYRVDWGFTDRLRALSPPRRAGATVTPFHADVAACAQEALEEAVLHLLRHARRQTGEAQLALAGGVAHNCSLNGAIARTGRFEEIFVHPASHDAGTAVGAAYAVQSERGTPAPLRRVRTVAWGPSPPEPDVALDRWGDWVDAHELDDGVVPWAARRIVSGEPVPWAQGRSEFGPRALGHRSLLADPRDRGMRDRINALVKYREQFRPFAPVVRAEDVDQYFEIPLGADCSFMSFAVPVRPERAVEIPAVTHVDGTARLQILGRDQDQRLWSLLGEVGDLTGTPVLLNTSLNINGEPIVETLDDFVAFLLTTTLGGGVWGGHVIVPRGASLDGLALSLPSDAQLCSGPDMGGARTYWLERGAPRRRAATVSPDAYAVLSKCADGDAVPGWAGAGSELQHEVTALWRKRLVQLSPPATAGGRPTTPVGRRQSSTL